MPDRSRKREPADINKLAKAVADEATEPVVDEALEMWIWVTVDDGHSCKDCQPRHNQIKSLLEWRRIGMPVGGWSECGKECRCMIMPAVFAEAKLDMRQPIKLDRAAVIAIGERAKAMAVELGRRGGRKGGKARAAKMTPEERSEAARKAALIRWKSKTKI